ncbi:MAG TPA: efflux RND transporter periplasmic adaptor subunit [Cellvibrio sp.]|nr:efflux RND transporter periplasmic adaptor subunit [Cellvibrio sp.]
MKHLPHFLRRGIVPGVVAILVASITFSVHAQTPADKAVEVIVQTASIKSLTTSIEALGTLRANESISLTSNETKKITRINFEDGQRVNKSQVLVEMTSREESALLEEARFNADEAKKQLDRVRQLAKSGAAAQSLLDQRIREYEAARARYNATESRLKDLILLAPFSGIVGLREVSVGALVSPGDQITTLNDDSVMKLDFTVPAIYLRSLSLNLPIVARSRDLDGREFTGTVYSIDNQIDEITRSIKVRALLDNKNHELKQGMLMLVDLRAGARDAVVISESALVPLGSNNFVFVVVEEQGKTIVQRRQVTIGERLAGSVEILKGVDAGDKLVTHGLQKVRPGQAVKITAEEQPAAEKKGDSLHLSDLINTKKH